MGFMYGSRVIRVAMVLCLLVVAQPVRSGGLQFEHLLTDEFGDMDDSISSVNAIAQDLQGFMWFGGENGLARYDGHQLVFYHAGPNGLSGSYVTSLAVDKTGVLWVGSHKGLDRYDAQHNRFDHFTHDPQNPASLPYDSIYSIVVDAQNNLWIGTGQGVVALDASRQHFRQFLQGDEPHSLSANKIRPMKLDSHNRLWIGTHGGGLNRVDKLPAAGEPLRVERYPMDDHNPDAFSRSVISAIEEDSQGRIWVGTHGGGISRLNTDLTTFKKYSLAAVLANNAIWAIKQDRSGELWIGSDKGGLSRYLPDSDSFVTETHSDIDNRSLLGDTVRALFADIDGDLWIGNFPAGVNYFNHASAAFSNFSHQQGNPASLSNKAVVSFLQDSDGDIWVGTEDGLNKFDPVNGTFKAYLKDPSNPKALQAGAVISLAEGAKGELWVGTWSGGLYRFNKRTGDFHPYFPTGAPGAINSSDIWHILYDRQQRLWVATQIGGLNLYDRRTDSFRHYTANSEDPDAVRSNYIWNLLEDSKGRIWVATDAGLDLFNPDTGKFRHLTPPATGGDSKNRSILELMEHSNGQIWMGTQDRGLLILDPDTETFTTIAHPEALASPWVTSLVEDDDQNVWASTYNGVWRINVRTGVVKNFSRSQGLVGNAFNRDASFKDRQGNIYVGGTEGFSRFNPHQIAANLAPRQPVLTELRVQNTPAAIPHNAEELALTYDQNSLALSFSAMSFRGAKKNQYQYKLVGFDGEWSSPKASNQAIYTNLSPGRYIFQVRAANSDGVWSVRPLELPLYIAPPPWRTLWAYTLYLLLGLCFVAAIAWAMYAQIRTKRLELSSEKALTLRLRRLDKMKDAFLANTSHELRTPLNGIIGLAEALTDNALLRSDPATLQSLQMIAVSGRRLAHLVNDILDSAKLADRQLVLAKTPVDLLACVANVLVLLKPMAEQKQLDFVSTVPAKTTVLADENRLQQILFNLIGNAVKYSSTGSIRISAKANGEMLRIEVADRGMGIAADDLEKIFIAFNQLADSDTRSVEGSGLGLAITKQLVELHGGNIFVCSELGVGSQFSFTLPYQPGLEPLTAQPTPLVPDIPPTGGEPPSDPVENFLPEPAPALLPTVLVVDDDLINRMVIRRLLAQECCAVLEASSGAEALEALAQHQDIQLVLLDIMMPQMSGYETCEILRRKFTAEQLPVIFLSSKDQDDDRIRAYLAGGSDYLTKPVNKAVLLQHLQQHVTAAPADSSALNVLAVLQALNNQAQDQPCNVVDRLPSLIAGALDASLFVWRQGTWVTRHQSASPLVSLLQPQGSAADALLGASELDGGVTPLVPALSPYFNLHPSIPPSATLLLCLSFEAELVGCLAFAFDDVPGPLAYQQLKLLRPWLTAWLLRAAELP